MYSQAAAVILKILLFRAGPQDLPYSTELTRLLLPLAVAANYCVFALVLPVPMAVVMALMMIGGMALATRSLLRARQMPERYNQTFNALLATGAVLTFALLPPFSAVAPKLLTALQDPKVLENPEALDMPQGAVLLMNALNFWNLAVTSSIFRHAMNVNLLLGVLIALLVAFITLFAVMFGGTLVGTLLG